MLCIKNIRGLVNLSIIHGATGLLFCTGKRKISSAVQASSEKIFTSSGFIVEAEKSLRGNDGSKTSALTWDLEIIFLARKRKRKGKGKGDERKNKACFYFFIPFIRFHSATLSIKQARQLNIKRVRKICPPPPLPRTGF